MTGINHVFDLYMPDIMLNPVIKHKESSRSERFSNAS